MLSYLLTLFLSYKLSFYSYWWVLLLAIPAHFFHARMFIVMHDCGHYSFFKSRKLNNIFGHITGFFYYTPFYMWRELHNKHHVNQGNLDRRGQSLDVWTLTKAEYRSASNAKKILYNLYRNPLVLLFIAPLFLFFIIFRIPFEKFSTKAVINIFVLDLLIALMFIYAPAYLLIQLPSLLISLVMASFLFYIQHQFENTMWVRSSSYSNELISLQGSSYMHLPAFFDWTYGYIGYHHIHHLDVKIPMYRLKQAQADLQYNRTTLGLKDLLKSLKLRLWDESTSKMI